MTLPRRLVAKGASPGSGQQNSRRSERGDTLVELLVTLVILGVSSLALLTAFSTSISASAEHRSFATFDTALRSASESVFYQIEQQPSPYFSNCPVSSPYYSGVSDFGVPPGYNAAITSVQYWNGTTFASGACPTDPKAPQQITITVTAPDSTFNSIDVVVASPTHSPTATPGVATHLAFTTQPGGATAGSAFTAQPVVKVLDGNGNVVTADSSSLSLGIDSGTPVFGGPGVLTGCSSTETAGVFTFSGCTINASGTAYALTANDSSLVGATSTSFNVMGPATHLVFSIQPVASHMGQLFTTQPVVRVEDANSNVVTADSSIVTLTIVVGSGTSGAILSGCSGIETFGVVNFSGCTIDKAGSGYILRATDPGLVLDTSSSFTVSP